jgi:hypothetical protein
MGSHPGIDICFGLFGMVLAPPFRSSVCYLAIILAITVDFLAGFVLINIPDARSFVFQVFESLASVALSTETHFATIIVLAEELGRFRKKVSAFFTGPLCHAGLLSHMLDN